MVAHQTPGIVVTLAEPVAYLVGVLAGGVGRMCDRRRAARSHVREELLDRLPTLAGFLLDPADELLDVPLLDPEVVLGQLTPALPGQTADVIPLSLNCLHVDRHGRLDSVLRDLPVRFRLPRWISFNLNEPLGNTDTPCVRSAITNDAARAGARW